MDNYVEHLVKRNDPGYFKLLKVLCIVLDIAMLPVALSFLPGILLLLLAAGLSYVVWLNASVEYEYLYINGSFSVDKIMNRSRRKKLIESDASELLLVAPKNSPAVKDLLSQKGKALDLSGKGAENRKYAYIFQRAGETSCLYIEMTDALLREMRNHSPSKVKMQ